MNIIQAAQYVLDNGYTRMTLRKDDHTQVDLPRKKGMYLDAFTSSMIVQVTDRISEDNKAKLLSLPVLKAVDILWKVSKGA